MSNRINKAKWFLYTLIKHTFDNNAGIGEKKAVIFVGHIGDAILFADCLKKLEEHYRKDGLVCICNEEAARVFDLNNFDSITIYRMIKVDSFGGIDYRDFKEIVEFSNSLQIDELFVFTNANFAKALGASIKGNNKYLFDISSDIHCNRILLSVIKKSYKHIEPFSLHFLPAHFNKFINDVLLTDYECERPCIQRDTRSGECEKYMVFAPVSRSKERTLTALQWNRLLEFLIDIYDGKIYITGTKDDRDFIDLIIGNTKSEKIVNCSGKTTFSEFIELINHSDFLVGIDSGHIHLASALGIRNICITGGWDAGQFLPYAFKNENKHDPVVIKSKTPYVCEGCKLRNGPNHRNIDNKECLERTNSNGNYLCLSDIRMDDVFDAIISLTSK